VSRLSLALNRHDPYWDMDGAGARRQRLQRRAVRLAIWALILTALAVAATRLPAIDPEFLIHGEGRPILAGSLLTILAAAAHHAHARIRHVRHS
jgi:hypothetical protein